MNTFHSWQLLLVTLAGWINRHGATATTRPRFLIRSSRTIYTRDKWFPAIRMIGTWLQGAGLNRDIPSTYRKVFRVVDLMRYCGGDVYHRDWEWRRRLGDWDGPDWRSANDLKAPPV